LAITASDVLFKFSVKTGSAGDSTAGTAAGSLGKYISTTAITDASLHNLFDIVTGDENAASDVEYRAFFVHNNHATLTWESVVVWISNDVSGGTTAAISVDATGVTAKGSSSAQAKEVADESTAPSTQTFTAPTSKATGLAIGNIPAGSVAAVWVRRTAANTSAVDSDGVTISVSGDTAA
jgi:hypothetical protein